MKFRALPLVLATALLVTVAACGSSGTASLPATDATNSTAQSSAPSSQAAVPSAQNPQSASSAAGSSAAAASSGEGDASGADAKSLLPPDVKPGSTLTVADDPTDPPFDSIEGTQFVGVDYEIAQALGTALGVKIEFKQIGFDGIIPALQSHRFDMAMSAISDLKKRQATVDFVDYFNSGYAIVVNKGNPDNITTLDDFCGTSSGAQSGNQQVLILQAQSAKCESEGKKAITIKVYPDYSQMKLELQQHRLSAILQGIAGAAYVADTTNGALQMVKTDQVISPSPYGIAFPKGSPLVKPFQAALQEIIDDGTYGQILAKWKLDVGALKTATVNAATQ